MLAGAIRRGVRRADGGRRVRLAGVGERAGRRAENAIQERVCVSETGAGDGGGGSAGRTGVVAADTGAVCVDVVDPGDGASGRRAVSLPVRNVPAGGAEPVQPGRVDRAAVAE